MTDARRSAQFFDRLLPLSASHRPLRNKAFPPRRRLARLRRSANQLSRTSTKTTEHHGVDDVHDSILGLNVRLKHRRRECDVRELSAFFRRT